MQGRKEWNGSQWRMKRYGVTKEDKNLRKRTYLYIPGCEDTQRGYLFKTNDKATKEKNKFAKSNQITLFTNAHFGPLVVLGLTIDLVKAYGNTYSRLLLNRPCPGPGVQSDNDLAGSINVLENSLYYSFQNAKFI